MRAGVQRALGFNGGTEAPPPRRRRRAVDDAIIPGRKRDPGVREFQENRKRAAEEQATAPTSGGYGGQAIGQPGKAGISQGGQAGLGHQLTRRVDEGAIDQGRAEQTAQERQTLEAAFGPQWRTKVYGGRGIVQANNQALAAGSTDPNVAAFHEQLMQERKRLLALAAEKLARQKGLDPDTLYQGQ